MSIAFDERAAEMRSVFVGYGIRRLYHFTAIDNLSNIGKYGGLWSKQKSERAGLLTSKIITGGNQLSLNLDRRYRNWDKVHLYFCPNTPMAYRIQQNSGGRDPQSAHICYLSIDSTVAMWKGVYFTDTNATGDGHKRGQGLDGLKLVDFRTIRAHLNERWIEPKQRWLRNVQAECLVPNEIPLKYIRNISFISDASLKEGERLWGSADHPPFRVAESFFHRGFPLVESFFLTSREVNGENIEEAPQLQGERFFSAWATAEITLVVYLQATTGSRAAVIWRDIDDRVILEDETEFEKESGYWHWPSLKIADLDGGDYSVEYYLDRVRWFKTYFEIRG